MSFGTDKSSGSIAESQGSSSGSTGSDGGNGNSNGSSGSSGSGAASFDIANAIWSDTSVGDPSVIDFDVINTGTENLQIAGISATSVGFYPTPSTFPIALPVGATVQIFANTDAGEYFTGTSITVTTDLAGSKTITLS